MSVLLIVIIVLGVFAVRNKVRRGSFSFWRRKGPQNW